MEMININEMIPENHFLRIRYETYLGINVKKPEEAVKQETFNTIVKKKIVSVTSKIIYVLRNLYKSGKCTTDSLFDGLNDRSERVAVFLAVLELTKSGRILLNDDNTEITFNKNYTKRIEDENNADKEEPAVSYS